MTDWVARIAKRSRLRRHVRARPPVPLYRPGDVNHCVGCGSTAWHLGRASAECARCGDVLPFTRADATVRRELLPA